MKQAKEFKEKLEPKKRMSRTYETEAGRIKPIETCTIEELKETTEFYTRRIKRKTKIEKEINDRKNT